MEMQKKPDARHDIPESRRFAKREKIRLLSSESVRKRSGKGIYKARFFERPCSVESPSMPYGGGGFAQ